METLAGVKLPTGIGKQETFRTTNRPFGEKRGLQIEQGSGVCEACNPNTAAWPAAADPKS